MLGTMTRTMLTLALLIGACAAQAESCALDRVDLRGPFGEARFSVEIADDEAERARGLMHRDSLPSASGMLFVYERPSDSIAFWMKNTLIPLDMLFITPDGVVQYVQSMARPGDETPIFGGPGVQAVLEIRGGLAGAIGIGPGSQLRHPAFAGATAAWPCEAAAAPAEGAGQ